MNALSDLLGGSLAAVMDSFPARGLRVHTNGEHEDDARGFVMTRKCPVCGKKFVLPCAASDYGWSVGTTEEMRKFWHIRNHTLTMCSYTCMRQMEKRKEDLHKAVLERLREKRREARMKAREQKTARPEG